MRGPSTRAQRQQLEELLKAYGAEFQRVFMLVADDLIAGADWAELVKALRDGDVGAAIFALHADIAAFAPLAGVSTAAYQAGAAATASSFRPAIRFDLTNPRAETWIRENAAALAVKLSDETKALARDVILEGYSAGRHPYSIAKDLIGSSPGPGLKRVGGVLPLDPPRAARLQIVRIGMETPEGVQDLVRVVNGVPTVRYKVNPDTAQKILKAWRDGTAVPEPARKIAVAQYFNALTKERAEAIAQTETAMAVAGGRREEWLQLVESKGLTAAAVIKTWHHRRGAKEGRQTHIAMGGKSVVGLDTPFVLPDNSVMLNSHDPEGGPKNNIHCGCDTTYRLDRTIGLL